MFGGKKTQQKLMFYFIQQNIRQETKIAIFSFK
jgi:hypothetical protein